MTTLQKIVIAVTIAVVMGTGVYFLKQHEVEQLRGENQELINAQQTLTAERDAALAAVSVNADESERLQREKRELLRLRGEVGLLRQRVKNAEALTEENRELRETLAEARQAANPEEPEEDSERQAAMQRMDEARKLVLGVLMYATEHNDWIPSDLSATSNYWDDAQDSYGLAAGRFELVAQGSLSSITNYSEIIVVRERDTAWRNGNWSRVYGFADGHSEIKMLPSEGFEAWEQQHMVSWPQEP